MRKAQPHITHWDQSTIRVDPEAFFGGQIDAIAAAQTSVEFEYYIFEQDSLGERFIGALAAAALRGVKVRVLIDGVGSSEGAASLSRRLTAAGVEVRIYHPLPWDLDSFRWSRRGGWMLAKLLEFLFKINRRNHRKLCVVDGTRAWVGSFNIAAAHLPEAAGGQGWRDYGVELTGPRVATLVESFDELWFGGKPRLRRGFIAGYLSNRSVAGRQLKNRFLVRSVVDARRRVWLVSAYFMPTASLRRALLQASRSGKDVRLLLPERSDVSVFPRASANYYRALLRAGARIFLYQPGVLHAKALLIDEFAIIGSSNWNHRSILHDLELDVVLRRQHCIGALESIIEGDIDDSRELLLENTEQPGMLSRLLYALRYWM